MPIRSIEISNFRSIDNVLNIPLTGKVTFLVGTNNAGKSNILRAMALLLNKDYESVLPDIDFKVGSRKTASFKVEFDHRHRTP